MALEIKEFLIEYIFTQILDSSRKFLKEKKIKISSSAKDIESAFADHTNQINNWSRQISFSDLKKSKQTSEVFIDIDIYLMPRKRRLDSEEQNDKIQCTELFNQVKQHCVILGQPGAGKTTLTKFLCQSIIHDESFYSDELKIPILIRLRDLNSYTGDTSVVISKLFDLCGLVLDKEKEDVKIKEDDFILAKKRILFPLLDNLKPLLILDGFDELATQKLKSKVLEEFKELTLSLKTGRILFTSRSSEYNYSIENTAVLEISPLSDQQINDFSKKWLQEKLKAEDFLKNLHKSPFADTSIRPLTLSHLCAIYERSGKIPDKPKTIYKKIVNLLLEEWDEQRDVKRLTEYANFEVDRKFEFLSRIAFEISIRYNRTVFSEEELKYIYYKIYFDFSLPKNEATKVVSELEGHTGLILQSRYKSFEFAHKSIHEYLCAEHLVKLPSLPKEFDIISELPNELAIAIAISSDPSAYFCELVFNRLAVQEPKARYFKYYSKNFIASFVNRLVIEKPDFNLSDNVSLALILLYTLLRQNHSGQLELFETDLPIQFEEFVQNIFVRNKKFEFTRFYTLHKFHDSETSEEIIELKKTKKGESYRDLDYPLPSTIFAKKSFIAGY